MEKGITRDRGTCATTLRVVRVKPHRKGMGDKGEDFIPPAALQGEDTLAKLKI